MSNSDLADRIITLLECRYREWLSPAEYDSCKADIANLVTAHYEAALAAKDAEIARLKLNTEKIPRSLPLGRDEAEWLVGLLENCDPAKEGTWRHDMADDIRKMFGMVSNADELAQIKGSPSPTLPTTP